MALSDKTNLLVQLRPPSVPEFEEGLRRFIADSLYIELSTTSLANAIQVVDNPPANPVKGMVRYAVAPWDPLGNGFSGLCVYNGNAWAAV